MRQITLRASEAPPSAWLMKSPTLPKPPPRRTTLSGARTGRQMVRTLARSAVQAALQRLRDALLVAVDVARRLQLALVVDPGGEVGDVHADLAVDRHLVVRRPIGDRGRRSVAASQPLSSSSRISAMRRGLRTRMQPWLNGAARLLEQAPGVACRACRRCACWGSELTIAEHVARRPAAGRRRSCGCRSSSSRRSRGRRRGHSSIGAGPDGWK